MTEVFPDISNPDAGPEDLHQALTKLFIDTITNQPRSLQKRIGPSEYGHPCDRRIGAKLAGAQVVNNRGIPWKPLIGTNMHEWAKETVARHTLTLPLADILGPRYMVEMRVNVGDEIDGEPLNGDCDIYDRVTATALDYKFVGGEQLRGYRANGPGPQYRVQAHSYARGWVRKGYPVRHVAVWFLPRDQEFRQNHFWSEPYDEQIVIDAMNRAAGISRMVSALGTAALPILSTADAMCTYCPYFLPASTEVEQACPGHPGATGYVR
ncbi:MAG: hypothetical protein JWO98_2567 [Frankiales bacterium]|nr:hypothetical protein [Frankiales bacterium]